MSSYSSLVTYFGSDCQRSNSRVSKVKKITIHHLAMVGNCETIQRVIQSTSASWNYGIGNDGQVGLFVSEDRRAWSGDTVSNDDAAVTIVVANSSTDSDYPISDKAYVSLISLCADICTRNGITKLVYVPNNVNNSTLTLHCQFNNNVVCPGRYIKSKLNSLCNSVNRLISSGTSSKTKRSLPEISTYDAVADNVVVLDPRDVVQKQKFTPYAITVGENVRTIDIEKLRHNKVSAVFLRAGTLYNSLHVNQHKYEAPNLASQMTNVLKYDFPRGLIAKVRARNIQEAKEECKWLHLVVEKYPADLGVWLDCEFTSDRKTNGCILDTYLEEFKRWGVDNKCGLYIDRKQLSKIDWNVYQVYYYLWLVDHSARIPGLNEIIDPTFFDV